MLEFTGVLSDDDEIKILPGFVHGTIRIGISGRFDSRYQEIALLQSEAKKLRDHLNNLLENAPPSPR